MTRISRAPRFQSAGALRGMRFLILSSPLPGVPAWSFQMEARAIQETGE